MYVCMCIFMCVKWARFGRGCDNPDGCVFACVYVCMYVCVCIHVLWRETNGRAVGGVYTHANTHTLTDSAGKEHVCHSGDVLVCMYVYMYACTNMYACILLYIYTHIRSHSQTPQAKNTYATQEMS